MRNDERAGALQPDGWRSEQRSLSGLITLTQRVVNGEFHRRLDAAGYADIRPGAGKVFEHIAPDGSTIATMAQRAGVTSQAMVQIVDYLERRGYVERLPDPTDRRAKLVRTTERGRCMTSTASRILEEMEAEFRAALGDGPLRELRGMLQVLIEVVERGPHDSKAEPHLESR